MKRLLIGLVAVAGLLGSVLALVASTSSPTSGQANVGTLTLTNGSTTDLTTTPPQTAADEQIRLSLTPVQGCTPRQGAAISNQVLNPGSSIFPVVDRNCSWTVTFGHTLNRCVATAAITLSTGTAVLAFGNPVSPTITLVGLPNGLQTTLQTAASVQAQAAARASNSPVPAAVTATGLVTSIVFSVDAAGAQCATSFTPTATINLPTGAVTTGSVRSAYAGLEFEVTFTTNRQGQLAALCATGTSTYVVDRNGAVAPKRDSNNMQMLANLVDRTLGDLAGTGRCTYTASFSSEVGGLRPTIAGVTYPTGRTDISGETPSGEGATATVSVTYERITVSIVVRSTFPADEVFTTEDRVGYTVSVDSPCGGYLGVLPRGLGNQGDSASAQVFPGTVLVYGSQLRAITQGTTAARTYSVTAFSDVQGTTACSVTVTEDSGPERCSVVGGASSTQTYSAGDAALTFEFTHTCEPTAAASTDGGEGEGTNGPPAPPAIDLGDGDTATTPSGPPQEGRTG